MLYKEFEKNREDILENEFCMQSDASTLPITDCPSYTPICTIGICIQGNAKIRMDLYIHMMFLSLCRDC